MLAKSAIPVCRGNVCGTWPRGSVQGHVRKGHMALLRRSGAPATTAAVARTRSSLIIAAAAPAVPIKIQVEYRADFGQVLKVVGAGEILGDWDPKQAPAMEWQDGDIWSTTFSLPTGKHEFKLVVAAADATSAIWEGGNNRSVTVPPLPTTGGSSYIAECYWNNPETTMKPAGPEGVGTYDEGDDDADKAASFDTSGTGTQTVGKMTIENAGNEVVDDDEEKEIGKMTVEGGESGIGEGGGPISEVGKMTIGKMTIDQGQQQDTTPSTTTTVGKMTIEGGVSVRNDLIDSGIGAEEGSAAAAAMTPEVALSMASGDEDQLESPFAKAISSFFQNIGLSNKDGDAREDDDDDKQGGSGGGGSSISENKPSGGRGGSSSGKNPPSGSTGGSPFSLKFAATAAVAAAVVMMSSPTTATALPLMALPPPTNPRSPLTNVHLSSWVGNLPSPFASPAQAEDLLGASPAGGGGSGGGIYGSEEMNSDGSATYTDQSAFNNATMSTVVTPAVNETSNNNNNKNKNTFIPSSAAVGVASSSTSTTATDNNGINSSGNVGTNADDDSSTLEEFRERLRWLNKVTAEATQELDAIAPPPLKSALDSAVKAAKETDVKPALDVAKRVVGDLQEGFSGLFSAAKEFDAATASAELKARMEKELEARKEIEAATAAAAHVETSTDSGKASSEQQQQGAAGVRTASSASGK